MSTLKFLQDPTSYNPEHTFTAHINNAHGKEDLLRKIHNALHLPEYVGFNWDAVSDCLTDLHWIAQKGVVLIHDNYPKLNPTELAIYLELLFDAVRNWKAEDDHYLEVVFPALSVQELYPEAINQLDRRGKAIATAIKKEIPELKIEYFSEGNLTTELLYL